MNWSTAFSYTKIIFFRLGGAGLVLPGRKQTQIFRQTGNLSGVKGMNQGCIWLSVLSMMRWMRVRQNSVNYANGRKSKHLCAPLPSSALQ